MQPPRQDISDVVDLAGLRLGDRLDALRPTPARLKGVPADGGLPALHYLNLPVVEGPGLVRAFQSPVRHAHLVPSLVRAATLSQIDRAEPYRGAASQRRTSEARPGLN